MDTDSAENGRGRVVLVDGYGQIYRAFHAIRGLGTSEGKPTNALFGVARFLQMLERSLPHEYGAVVFDLGRPEERLAVLPEYKATRPPMPDELKQQLDPIRQWIRAAGWALLEEDGWEADDVLAGAAKELRGRYETYLVSRDKDMAQLVGDGVYQVIPGAKGKLEILDPESVEAKYGVTPGQIPDYLALVGDASDNVPGVPGVGPKTAQALLQRFGSLDALLANLDAVEPERIRRAIAESRDLLTRNRILVELSGRLPPSWPGLDGLRRREPDLDALLDLCRQFELRSFAKKLEALRRDRRNPSLF